MSCLLFILAVYHLYFISAQLMWSTYNLVVRVQWQQRASLFYSLTHTPCWPLSHRATCSVACVVPPFPCPKLLQHWMWHADTRRDMLLCKAEAIETLHFQFSSKFRAKKKKKIPTRPRSPCLISSSSLLSLRYAGGNWSLETTLSYPRTCPDSCKKKNTTTQHYY